MTSYETCTSGTSRVLTVASLYRPVENGGSYSSSRRLSNAICGKVFECTEHSAERNTASAVPGLWSHTGRSSTHLLQEFSWKVFNHLPYSPDLAPSYFRLFLHLKKFLSSQRQCFQNAREVEMSVTVVPIPGGQTCIGIGIDFDNCP